MTKRKPHIDETREPGRYTALPASVTDSIAYMSLSHTARSLLIELARQRTGGDNGRLLLSMKHLNARGWHSADVVTRAKRELIASKLVYQTVMGYRPNKASWYALTWYSLDKINGYDPGVEAGFRRGMYNTTPLPKPKLTREELFKKWEPAGKTQKPNHFVIPSHGIGSGFIAPSHGIESEPPIPSHGTMKALLTPLPIPSHGNPLALPFCTGISSLACLRVPNEHDDGGFDRVRDSELDPSMFDPNTGEYFNRPSGKQKKCADSLEFSTEWFE